MAKRTKLIEPIPASMEEIVSAIFANHPKPKDLEKQEKFSDGVTCSSDQPDFPPESEESQK